MGHRLDGLRVMHVVPGYAPAQGGIETLIDGLAPQLLMDHGIHSSILAPRRWFERPDVWSSHGVAVESVDIPNTHAHTTGVTPIVRMFAAVRGAVERERPSVVHIHGIGHLLVPATRVAKASGIPTILHVHGSVHPQVMETEARAIRESTTVVAVSEPTAESIRDIAGRRAPVLVIGNGIPAPTEASRRTLPSTITMVGRLEPNKGFEHGIAALARLTRRFGSVQLRIIGVGESLIPLQRLAEDLGVARKVHFFGRCDRHLTREVIAESEVVLIPSLTIEGFSLVAAEAAFLGVPVVAYRTGGLSSTVLDGRTGIVVDRGDVSALAEALARVLTDTTLRSRLSEEARRHAQSAFSVESFADRIAGLYAAAVGVHGR